MSNSTWQDQLTDTAILEELLTLETYVSIIVPAFNEASCIEENLFAIEQEIDGITRSYEIIIAEDGSVDGTDLIAESLSREKSRITHLHSDERRGKGAALNRAFLASTGNTVVFMDADLATNLQCLSGMLKQIERGYDLVIGSRYVEGAHVERPLSRTVSSLVYNFLVRLIFRDEIHDHQCGFKMFRSNVLDSIGAIDSNGFVYDTELLVRAKKLGYSIVEYPVTWKEPLNRKSKINILRDGFKMGLELLKLRIKLWKL